MSEFSGFSKESLDILKQVKINNSKIWFEKHHSEYEKYLLTPFRELVSDLTPMILSVDPDIEVRPAINKTISRIFRDTRFSKDKSLFRDTMWLVFKRPGSDWKISIPGFYFEISYYCQLFIISRIINYVKTLHLIALIFRSISNYTPK